MRALREQRGPVVIRLGHGQLLVVSVGIVLVSGLVFFGGVVVGRRTAPPAAIRRAAGRPGALDVAPAQAQAPRAKVAPEPPGVTPPAPAGQPALTFHARLAAGAPDAGRPTAAAGSDSGAKGGGPAVGALASGAPDADGGSAVRADARPARIQALPAQPPAVEPVAASAAADILAPPPDLEATAPAPVTPAAKPAVDALAAQATAALARLRQARRAATPGGHPAPLATGDGEGDAGGRPAPAEAARGGLRFTLQVSSFQEQPEARALVEKLRARGYNPYTIVSNVPGRGRWYRVRVGKFASRQAAETFQRRFERKETLDTFVSPL